MADLHGSAAKSPFAVARERLALLAQCPAAGGSGLQDGWSPLANTAGSSEGSSDDESVAMWQEISAEGCGTSSMACAAANAATALAQGGPLPPGITAAVHNSVPGLLTLDVHVPDWQPKGQETGISASPSPVKAPVAPPAACVPDSGDSGGSPRCRSSGGDPTTLHMAMACGGYPQGTCTFTLACPASEAEREQLASFCGRLGCELERARYHLAKQQLEGSLDELSQALAGGGASSLRSASLPDGLALPMLPTLPSWRSTASAPASATQGWGDGSGGSSPAASPTFRATTPPKNAGQELSFDTMDEGA